MYVCALMKVGMEDAIELVTNSTKAVKTAFSGSCEADMGGRVRITLTCRDMNKSIRDGEKSNHGLILI